MDLRVPAGTTLALVGESVSGKSSIVQLACRFYDPDQGAVRAPASAPILRLGRPAVPARKRRPCMHHRCVQMQRLALSLVSDTYVRTCHGASTRTFCKHT